MSTSSFIVTFKKGTPQEVIDEQIEKTKASGCKIKDIYKNAILGFSCEVSDELVSTLSFNSPDINFIEADGVVTTQGQSLLTKD